jgi:hypothetical protein
LELENKTVKPLMVLWMIYLRILEQVVREIEYGEGEAASQLPDVIARPQPVAGGGHTHIGNTALLGESVD